MNLAWRGRCVRGIGAAGGILALGLMLQGVLAGCARDSAGYPELTVRAAVATADLSGIAAGGGRFHAYRAKSGIVVNVLVYRDGSGTPHALLDACHTCSRWKQGYLLEHGEVVCRKCGERYKLDALARGVGSCVPMPLNAEQRGGELAIPAGELEAAAQYF